MLPAAAALQRQGANKGATTAFLISTPESGVDSIAITYALLDPIMTVVRPLAAFVTGMGAGLVENLWNWRPGDKDRGQPAAIGNRLPTFTPDHERPSLAQRCRAAVRYGCIEVWGDIAGWFFIGVLIASVISVFVPDAFIAEYLGGGLLAMLLMLLVGVPIYICASASTPIAAALILKGVSPGAALVFLLVGPATNVTTLTVLFGMLGKWSTLRYLLLLACSAVGFGMAVDWLYLALGIEPKAVIGEAAEFIPHWLQLAGVVVLLGLSITPLYRLFQKIFNRRMRSNGNTYFVSTLPLADHRQRSLFPHTSDCGCGHGR